MVNGDKTVQPADEGPVEPSVREKLEKGIAAYAHEQRVFVRLLRKRGSFTESEFDAWFRGREWRRPTRFRPVTGDTLILGMGRNGGSNWAEMLALLQVMIQLDIIEAKKKRGVGVVYSLRNGIGLIPTAQVDRLLEAR